MCMCVLVCVCVRAVVAYQFDRELQGRIIYNAGFPSSIQTSLVYSSQQHHASVIVQVGLFRLDSVVKFKSSSAFPSYISGVHHFG